MPRKKAGGSTTNSVKAGAPAPARYGLHANDGTMLPRSCNSIFWLFAPTSSDRALPAKTRARPVSMRRLAPAWTSACSGVSPESSLILAAYRAYASLMDEDSGTR
jgi:hypothetical protein